MKAPPAKPPPAKLQIAASEKRRAAMEDPSDYLGSADIDKVLTEDIGDLGAGARAKRRLEGVQRVGFELLHTGAEGGPKGLRHASHTPFHVIASGRLPLAQHGTLSWCGFADEHSGMLPMVLNSQGMMLGLSEQVLF